MKKLFFVVTIFAFLFFTGCMDQPTAVEDPVNEDAVSLAKANYTFADHYIVEYTNESKF